MSMTVYLVEVQIGKQVKLFNCKRGQYAWDCILRDSDIPAANGKFINKPVYQLNPASEQDQQKARRWTLLHKRPVAQSGRIVPRTEWYKLALSHGWRARARGRSGAVLTCAVQRNGRTVIETLPVLAVYGELLRHDIL